LNEKGSQNKWLDARQIVKTSDDHRAGEVDLSLSSTKLHEQIDKNRFSIFIIQGFIGSDKNGLTTTLGREGSDYTAAVVAYMVNASELIFWKDVRGIYNADPKHFVEAKLIKELNYKNASELTDLGAKVLHHRTIQPLKERNILVQLRSFLEPNKAGTFIKQDFKDNKELPVIVHRLNKIILKIKARDLSSISDLDRKEILEKIKMHHLEVNYENFLSGTYYVCLNHFVEPVISLRDDLQKFFKLELFFGVTMVKIKYSNADINAQIVKNQEIIAQDIVNGIQFFFF
jgi:aspartate kinase